MWEIDGIKGGGNAPPPVAGQFSGTLLVMGGGRTIWEDLEKFPHQGDLGTHESSSFVAADVMAINDIGAYYHHTIRHWATLHTDYMAGWMKYRLGHNYGNRGHVFTHGQRPDPAIQFVWDLEAQGGTSGLFGVLVGLLLGYQKIVLAGMPMDNSGHFFGPSSKAVQDDSTCFADRVVTGTWQWARDNVFKGRVRSLSGRTRERLGEPDKAWLQK